jgi:hypothetical protein
MWLLYCIDAKDRQGRAIALQRYFQLEYVHS